MDKESGVKEVILTEDEVVDIRGGFLTEPKPNPWEIGVLYIYTWDS